MHVYDMCSNHGSIHAHVHTCTCTSILYIIAMLQNKYYIKVNPHDYESRLAIRAGLKYAVVIEG